MAETKSRTRRPAKDDHIIILKTERVSVNSLQGYHKNPRIGDVDAIAVSLDQNGQYRPILVNVGSKTGRKNEVLAGNHVWLASRKKVTYTDGAGKECTKPAWTHITASFVDVDEDTAKKIVLADNRLSDMGTYENTILAELFKDMPDITGTGYLAEDVDEILKSIETDTDETMQTIDDLTANMPEDELAEKRSKRQQALDEEGEESRDAAKARGASRTDLESDKDIEDIPADAEFQVVLELREENIYKGGNHWEIPDLRRDMLLDEFPEPIRTWGGKDATPDDGETWWLYQYGLGGRSGLPIDRCILSFFTHDDKFENWFEFPAFYTARFIGLGLKYVVVPDYSFYYTETRTHHLWSQYKAQWMGRFFQEAGLQVIPRVQLNYADPDALEVALLGVPRDLPTLATSQQNVEDEKENGPKLAKHLHEALTELNPQQLLYYSGPPGKRVMESTKWFKENRDRVTFVENYAAVRRNTVFDKKQGGAKLTAKQRKQLVEKHGGRPKQEWDKDPDEE